MSANGKRGSKRNASARSSGSPLHSPARKAGLRRGRFDEALRVLRGMGADARAFRIEMRGHVDPVRRDEARPTQRVGPEQRGGEADGLRCRRRQRPVVGVIVVRGVGDDEIGPDLGQQAGEWRRSARRRAAGLRRGSRGSAASRRAAPPPPRPRPGGCGAVRPAAGARRRRRQWRWRERRRTHRAPGEERAADEDLQIVGVRAEREDPDCAFRSRHRPSHRLRHARNDSMMRDQLRNRGLARGSGTGAGGGATAGVRAAAAPAASVRTRS